MKHKTYIYGRTLNIDFREICSPEEGLPAQMASLVRELINTDAISNGDIDRPRYLFVRNSGQVLFGLGFNHRQYLQKELQTDFSGRRGLRSFVGIVIEESEFDSLQSIPIDTDFYINLYLKYVSDVWNLEDRPKNRKVIVSDITEHEPMNNWCKLDGNISFNTDNTVCRFFNPADESRILSSIKRCSSDILIGLNVESHVLTALRRFKVNISNALCLDTKIEHDYELIAEGHNEKQEKNSMVDSKNLMSINWGEDDMANSSQVDRDKSSFGVTYEDDKSIRNSRQKDASVIGISEENSNSITNNGCSPKKDYRLKVIVLGAIAVFIVGFMLGRCSKSSQTNPQKSVSGDTVKTVKNIQKK